MYKVIVTNSGDRVDAKERRRRLAQVFRLILSWEIPELESSEPTDQSDNQECLFHNESTKPQGGETPAISTD